MAQTRRPLLRVLLASPGWLGYALLAPLGRTGFPLLCAASAIAIVGSLRLFGRSPPLVPIKLSAGHSRRPYGRPNYHVCRFAPSYKPDFAPEACASRALTTFRALHGRCANLAFTFPAGS